LFILLCGSNRPFCLCADDDSRRQAADPQSDWPLANRNKMTAPQPTVQCEQSAWIFPVKNDWHTDKLLIAHRWNVGDGEAVWGPRQSATPGEKKKMEINWNVGGTRGGGEGIVCHKGHGRGTAGRKEQHKKRNISPDIQHGEKQSSGIKWFLPRGPAYEVRELALSKANTTLWPGT
jgi:hypothetical protein